MLHRYPFKSWCIALGLFVLCTTLPLGLWTIQKSISATTKTIFAHQAPLLTALGHAVLSDNNNAYAKWVQSSLYQNKDLRLTILDTRGQVLLDSHFQDLEAHESRPEIRTALSGKMGEARRFSKTSKDELYYVAFPITSGNTVIGVSRIAIPAHALNETAHRTRTEQAPFYFGFAFCFLVLIVAIYLVNKKQIKQVVTALEENPETLRHDLTAAHNPEIKEACVKLAEKLATELLQKESALEEKKAILNNLSERVLLVAQNDEIVHLNPAAKQLFSISHDNVLYASQACRNSLFIDSIRETLKKTVVNNRRILFHSPTGPVYLSVTGVPVILNKQTHALMLIANPTYTWMPTYTKLIQLWIDKKDKTVAAQAWLSTLNEAHSKLCKGQVNTQVVAIPDIIKTAASLDIAIINNATESKKQVHVELGLLLTILIALKLCYHQSTLEFTSRNNEEILNCVLFSEISREASTGIDPTLRKFIDEFVLYFQGAITHSPTGFHITFLEG
jgi:hypothetical protein